MTRDPTDARLVTKTIRTNTGIKASDRIGNSGIAPPPAVATPLPPRVQRASGATWPIVAAAHATEAQGRDKTNNATSTGIKPFMASTTAVKIP